MTPPFFGNTCKSGDASSPFDRLRVRTTERPVEILMLSLSKHENFGRRRQDA